ncbi:EH signature domain-containing protein [Marinomonas sp. TI.3.20]|uniref:EH signature domain-containing protein n=1 Tax=Marinomonas sp. TI.3.20 TaxID=3121296 RepID=UPI00311FB613
MLQLPSIPRLQDAQWEKVSEQWVKLIANTKKIADSAGQSQEFKALEEGVRRLVVQGDVEQVKKILQKRRGVRVLTQLWIDSEEVRQHSFNESFIDHIKELHPKLGMSSLMNLISLLYRYFDDLNVGTAFHKLTAWLSEQIDLRLKDRKRGSSDTILSVLHQHKNWLFDITAPKAVVDLATKNHLDLNDQLKKLRLSELPQGRFLNICHAQYYLETLRDIPLGEDHEILSELSKTEVAGMPYEDGKRIGHIALEIIIDRSGGAPSSVWQNFVLDLAGDPRIASTAKNYREWWMPIGENRIKAVTSWLAKEDLRLFLGAIEEYGKQSGDEALNRMFPARKRFLEGLYEHGIIRNTRLMLGNKAASTVKRVLGKSMTTNFIKLSDSSMTDKAVIYLDCGDFHIIEGSHEFKLWIYMGLPSIRLSDYSLDKLSHSDLTVRFVRDFRSSYDGGQYKSITHSPTTWQKNAIEFLAENGVELDLEKVLSREDYQIYIRRFGVPVVKKITSDTSKTLEAQILRVLEINPPLKAKSIANALFTEFDLVVGKPKINSTLYSLRSEGKASLDDDYFWSLPNTNSEYVTSEPATQHSFDSLSFEGKRIIKKIEELEGCNLFILRTSLGVTASHCLKYIRGELAPFIEKDFKQMYRLKKK